MDILFFSACIVLILLFIGWELYKYTYYSSVEFKKLQRHLKNYIANCNALNEHIEQLKQTYTAVKKNEYGNAALKDVSKFNFRRPEQVKAKKSAYIYECSASICKNAETQPFKYLCKYFNITANEETLEKFEHVLNQFAAAEDGKIALTNELERIQQSFDKHIPILIKLFNMPKFMAKLGFQAVDISDVYVPVYTFRYISPGGNKTTHCNIKLDVKNLNKFVKYLDDVMKVKKSAAAQRALMTSKLREKIKKRDHYSCKKCGLSTRKEPNLLLEIDHIIPVSKGGLSTEDNLQTLCWKCNRAKGAKVPKKLATV